jgi:hypothetical protein
LLENWTAVAKPDGPFAIVEFSGALPRAGLFQNWEVNTNNEATLNELASASFDPAQKVLVASPPRARPSGSATNAVGGTVTIKSYAPRRIVLEANAKADSVLLFNEKIDPSWKVAVDGKPATDLRCNYIMQGVEVPPGAHEVEFRFEPPQTSLYVSIVTGIFGLVLLGFLAVTRREEKEVSTDAPPAQATERAPARAHAAK